jgi:hypothetical protein
MREDAPPEDDGVPLVRVDSIGSAGRSIGAIGTQVLRSAGEIFSEDPPARLLTPGGLA